MLGHHGLGKVNANGLLLLSLCAANDLLVTNTLLRQANKYNKLGCIPYLSSGIFLTM